MKKIVFFIALCFAQQLHATGYQGVGTIKTLRTHNFADADWITVDGFNSAGSCNTISGPVLLMIDTSQNNHESMMANILLAMGTNRTVRVGVDDTYARADGYCYLKWLNIED